ncbi:oxidoreductase [Streptomyces triculaminicus]|uniref:oxidoreductase n=1 Tax=Streptomyces triculaminicus TaxID=2816232 RepID=UPI0037D75F32
MMTMSYDAELVVVGAGPAGVAAAVMAASLKISTIVVEVERVGEKLHRIGAVENVPGSWTTGSQLAGAMAADMKRLQAAGASSLVQAQVTSIADGGDRAEVVLSSGVKLISRAVVVATGVTELLPADVSWMGAPDDFAPAPLWRSGPDDVKGHTYVLGADRPLGTWLRAHAAAKQVLHVLVPPADDYKTAEVSSDGRVRLVPVHRVSVAPSPYGAGWTVQVEGRDGTETTYAVDTVLNNLGSKPAAFDGLVQDEAGYCPPPLQPPRILVVGDLRSPRYQRITTAQGSGAEAALSVYYDAMLPNPAGIR